MNLARSVRFAGLFAGLKLAGHTAQQDATQECKAKKISTRSPAKIQTRTPTFYPARSGFFARPYLIEVSLITSE